ncbi:MFS transporter [Paraburkholderia jirisanensis]
MTNRLMVTARSLRSLDWLNFFVANVQTGFGPFIASYLATHKWTQGEIGLALSVGTISAMVSQVPGGAVVDALRNKKAAAAWATIAIIASAILLATSPTVLPVMAAEVLHGFASCMLVPAMAAISFALVGRQNLGDRLGRNARWASIGSAVAAGLMGLVGEYFSARAVFWLTAALAMPALFALTMIRMPQALPRHQHAPAPPPEEREEPEERDDLDQRDARAAVDSDDASAASVAATPAAEPEQRESILNLLRDRRLLIFAACVVLFHLSNAAMLNLAAGEVTAGMGDNVQLVIAACIIVPQAIVAMLSPWVGRTSQRWGRRPILLLGFSALPLRALLFAGVSSPYLLVPVQMLDGISAAVFGVMLPLIAADVAGGKGRYNLCIGLFGLAAGIGATLSTALAGFVADRFGSAISFFGLAGAGALAVLLVWTAMPETRDSDAQSKSAALPEAQ